MTNSERALELIREGAAVGLGSGKASMAFVQALGERVKRGLHVRGVPTSQGTARLAEELGIPLVPLEEAVPLDITIDGADEVDDRLDLIKGYGGALVREKVVAAASNRLVILVGPDKVDQKLVSVLGGRGVLPVEVVPFALPLCRRQLLELGLPSHLRSDAGATVVTDNGNYILDCSVTRIENPGELDRRILAIPGVVGTGLFVGMAHTVLIQRGDQLEERVRAGP
jgi:ribose 5-phosphate isomerase A